MLPKMTSNTEPCGGTFTVQKKQVNLRAGGFMTGKKIIVLL